MKTKTTAFSTLLLLSVLLLAGCATSRVQYREQSTRTDVALNQANYRMVRAAASGKSYGFRFLGIIPLVSPSYASARTRLYSSVGEVTRGRPVALANQMEDKSVLYLVLFSIPIRTLTADVIECTPAPPTAPTTIAKH
jgi:hypothetical protein